MSNKGVIGVTSTDQFNQFINDNSYVLVDYYTTWCNPCRLAAPVIKSLSKTYPEVVFLKVDADKLSSLSDHNNIISYPTFQIIQNGKEHGRFTGYDDKLENTIEEHLIRMLNL